MLSEEAKKRLDQQFGLEKNMKVDYRSYGGSVLRAKQIILKKEKDIAKSNGRNGSGDHKGES